MPNPPPDSHAYSIPESFIAELRDRADIVEVVGERVKLQRKGGNYFGLCPFHSEKTPSFSVNPNKGFYHCFGCGANGNAISFIMAHNGNDYIAAVEALAQRLGMSVPRVRGGKAQPDYGGVLRAALEHWQRCLRESDTARDYLKQRGLTAATVEKFGIAYARDNWDDLTRALPRYDRAQLIAANLQSEKNNKVFDYFRHRIIFPIFESNERLCGFGARALSDEQQPKYLNSAESARFSKRHTLYGLPQALAAAREKKRLIICEGYMDVVMLSQAGFGEAVAAMGTAATPQQMRKAIRAAPNLIFAFDGDAAGQKGAQRALQGILPAMKDGISILFLFLPEGDDPDSLIRRDGAAAFEAQIAQARGLTDFILDTVAEAAEGMEAAGRATAMLKAGEQLIRLINKSQAPYLHQLLSEKLSEKAGIDKNTVIRQAATATRPAAVTQGTQMNTGSLLFGLLCCLETDGNCIAQIAEDLPLPGNPQDAQVTLEVIMHLREQPAEEAQAHAVSAYLEERGMSPMARQIRRAADGRFAKAKDLKAECAQITARLIQENKTLTTKKSLIEQLNNPAG